MPQQLHCGKNILRARFTGSVEDDAMLLALAKFHAMSSKQFYASEHDLTTTDACPDDCPKKAPNAPSGTWTCTKFKMARTKQGKWRISYAFDGEVTITCG
jgi:hypothetical protein